MKLVGHSCPYAERELNGMLVFRSILSQLAKQRKFLKIHPIFLKNETQLSQLIFLNKIPAKNTPKCE